MDKVIRFLDALALRTGGLIAPLTLVMVLLTGVVVTARYLFQVGAIPLQESVVFLHGMVFMLAIGYTLKEKGHVRVDILYQRFSPRSRAIIDLLGTIVFLGPVCVFIFWTSLEYVSLSWSMSESSAEPGGLPGIYLLKTLIPLMAILLFLQGVAEALRSLTTLLGRDG